MVVITRCIAFKNKNSILICNRPPCCNSPCLCGYHKHFKIKEIQINYTTVIYDNNIDFLYKIKKFKNLFNSLIICNIIYKYYKKKLNKYYDYLDNHFKHFLLCGENSWREIDKRDIIKLNESSYYNIHFLINYMISQLNRSNMCKPVPIFPNNPFTRIKFTLNELDIIKVFINKLNLNININIVLKTFLSLPYKRWYNYSIKHNKDTTCENIRKHFYKLLRYQLINSLDSQNNFIGKWIYINEPNTIFEELYTEWIKIPPYILISNQLYPNPEKKNFWNILISCK